MFRLRNLSILAVILVVIALIVPGIGWAQEGNLAVSFREAGGSAEGAGGSPEAVACVGGLVADDGTGENGYGWNPAAVTDGGYYELYTPPGYPFVITQVCVNWVRLTADTDITYTVEVRAADGAGGSPGTLLGSAAASALGVPSALPGAFTDTALSVVVNSGSVYIGARWNPGVDQGFFIVSDENSATAPIGYSYNDINGFAPTVSIFPNYKAQFIRAEGIVLIGLAASAQCNGDNLEVTVINGDTPMTLTGTGPGLPVAIPGVGTQTITGPGTWTGLTLTEDAGDLESLALGDVTCPSAPVVAPGVPVPNLGLVQIGTGSPVLGFDSPLGNPLTTMMLPADADGNGFDTYIVTEVAEVNGELWVGLFVGSADWVFVPFDEVLPITAIRGID